MVFSVIMEVIAPGSGMFKLLGRNPSRKYSLRLKSRLFLGKERCGRKDRGDKIKRRIGLLLHGVPVFLWSMGAQSRFGGEQWAGKYLQC